jgi:hypothetical protein
LTESPPPPHRRRVALASALLGVAVTLLGLNMVIEEADTGWTPRLFLGIAAMACGLAGVGLNLWAALQRPR